VVFGTLGLGRGGLGKEREILPEAIAPPISVQNFSRSGAIDCIEANAAGPTRPRSTYYFGSSLR